jgi:ABC-type multidrug transport system ATPase subunit
LLLPKVMTFKQRRARAELMLEHMNLMHCRSTVIGSVLDRGISGGEAKRLNIGIALVPLPKVRMYVHVYSNPL